MWSEPHCDFTTIRILIHIDTQGTQHTFIHTHMVLLTLSPQGVLVPTSPKTVSMLIKIAQWQTLHWKSELLHSHFPGSYRNKGPWCVQLCACVGQLSTICGPHHCDVTNRGHSKDRDTSTIFSRTHVDLMTLCVIFGAQPSYRQITSSSVSLA